MPLECSERPLGPSRGAIRVIMMSASVVLVLWRLHWSLLWPAYSRCSLDTVSKIDRLMIGGGLEYLARVQRSRDGGHELDEGV
jgi:hypothetical protein